MSAPRRTAVKSISLEEETLFREALKDVRPLRKRRATHPRLAPPPKMIPPAHTVASAAPGYNDKSAPTIGGHADAHLRRGRLDPEARLDLHGMTHDEAYRSLVRFLLQARAGGQRLVLVITGKGGVLRKQLPYWLGQTEFDSVIAGIGQAHARHGGGGAFYVLLRKEARGLRFPHEA